MSDIFVVRQGIRTGCREAFILDEKELLGLPKAERKYFWPVAENQTISGGQILPGRHIFYGSSLESEADLIERCPMYRERYLLPNLDKLRARKGVSPDKYWVLTRPREWLPKREARLVSKMFGTTGAFGLDADGRFAIVQANGWFPRKGKVSGGGVGKVSISRDALAWLFGLQAYLELLNSRVFYMIIREYSVGVAGGQYELAPKYVNAMPMPDLWALLDRDPYATELARRATGANGREGRDQFAAYAYGTAIEDWPEIG